jgi:hypothetical protein
VARLLVAPLAVLLQEAELAALLLQVSSSLAPESAALPSAGLKFAAVESQSPVGS